MPLLFRRLPLTPVLLGLALAGILFCYEISERGGSRWQSVSAVRFAPDGKTLAAGMYNGRFVFTKGSYYVADLCATTALVTPGTSNAPVLLEQSLLKGIWNALPEVGIGRFVDWSPDGRLLAVGGFEGIARLYDVENLKEPSEFEDNTLHVHSVGFSPDGKTLATSFRYWIRLRDPQNPERLRSLEFGVNVAGFAFSPDGRMLAVADRGSCRVEFWNLPADLRSAAAEEPQRVAVFEQIDPDGRPDSLTAVAYAPDGKTLAIAGQRTVRLLDVESRKIRQILHERLVLDLAYSPDGRLLATGRYDGVNFWDAQSGAQVGTPISMPAAESLEFSPDSRQLATGDFDGNVTLWNVADQTKVWSTHLDGRYRLYMPLMVPPVLFVVWLAICGYLIWRWSRRSSRHRQLAETPPATP